MTPAAATLPAQTGRRGAGVWELGPAEVIAAAALIIAALAARYARESARASERSAVSAEASAKAATTSAEADATLARLAEDKRREELAPDLRLSVKRALGESSGVKIVTVENVGPQDWHHGTFRMTHDANGELPPVLVNGSQAAQSLGSMPHGHKQELRFYVQDSMWDAALTIEFTLHRMGDMEPTTIIKSIRFS